MATAMYLENCLDSLESLPMELQRNFKLMRDLDSRSQLLLQEIDELADKYLEIKSMSNQEKKTDQMNEIQKLFTKVKGIGDDKVQLAIQTYELVDKHIRRLDSDLARFEAEIKDKTLNSKSLDAEQNSTKKGNRKKIPEKEKKKGRHISSDEESAKGGRKKQKKSVSQENNNYSLGNLSHPTDVLDMPVDPNEPTYCLCHQVSYGEMIGCDNPDCTIEWFHFACVNLTTKPKGKWYCPKCVSERKKK